MDQSRTILQNETSDTSPPLCAVRSTLSAVLVSSGSYDCDGDKNMHGGWAEATCSFELMVKYTKTDERDP